MFILFESNRPKRGMIPVQTANPVPPGPEKRLRPAYRVKVPEDRLGTDSLRQPSEAPSGRWWLLRNGIR